MKNLLVSLLPLVLGLATCGPPPSPSPAATYPSPIIVYEITSLRGGASDISLTWQNDVGGTNQADSRTPFREEFDAFASEDFVYVSAQITTHLPGIVIRCRIYADAQVLAEASAEGWPSIATCSGSVP